MISIPAIEPAISTLPVKNQLIAKVSRVPRVRQLIALRTDLECVSAPRNNKATGALPLNFDVEPTMWRQSSALRLSCSRGKGPGDCACPAIGELFDLAIQLLSQRTANVAAWQASDGTVGAKAISGMGLAKRLRQNAHSLA